MSKVLHETGPGRAELAYLQDGPEDGQAETGFFWLGGFMSDMQGAKASAIAALARDTRRPSLRFDYSGHGRSTGAFMDGTISLWLAEAAHMFMAKTSGKRIIIGSSMGGWIALLLYRLLERSDPWAFRRVAGLVLVAPAADMTRDLMWLSFPEEGRRDIEQRGVYYMPSAHGEPYPITREIIVDGQRHLILSEPIDVRVPVRILQGTEDVEVPVDHALRLFETLRGNDITCTLIKGGDHRLSQAPQLALIRQAALGLAERADRLYP